MKTSSLLLRTLLRAIIFCCIPISIILAATVGPSVAAATAAADTPIPVQVLTGVGIVIWTCIVVSIAIGIAADHEDAVADYLDRHVWRDDAWQH
jgi:hypothetical protein